MTLPFTESVDWSEIWFSFIQANHLNEHQAHQFKSYLSLLIEWNERFNITAITDPQKIVLDHFQDSLALTQCIDRSMIKGIADIGSGGGFPGIPLKIVLPDIPVVLIEVNNKKRSFLKEVIQKLALKQIIISDLDWRTFILKTDYLINIFCARASLRPDELIRVFGKQSHYKNGQIVYWASYNWIDEQKILDDFDWHEHAYTIGNKKRKLIVISQNTSLIDKRITEKKDLL